jgi:plastocyanin
VSTTTPGVVALAVLAVAVAACGDGTDTAPVDESTGPSIGVTIEGFAFVPAEVTVNVGDTVRWTNLDRARHTTTAEDGTWDGSVSTTPFDVTLSVPGTYEYFCSIHRTMRGTVIVEG